MEQTTRHTIERPARGFPRTEYVQRLLRAQQAMRADGIDLLFLTTEADIRWFSGFLTPFWQSPTRPWYLLVPASGAPVAVIPEIGAACMRRTWLEDIRTWPCPDAVDDGIALLIDTIDALTDGRASATASAAHPAGARIGVPMGPGTHLRMPLAQHVRLQRGLAGATWYDAQGLVAQVRAIKSDAEIEKIRFVCHAASRAFDALPALVAPGMRDDELFRAFTIRCLQEGADEVGYLVGAAAPGGYADIISPPRGRRLRAGDVLILDTGCRYDGHFCDFDRNWAIGQVDPRVADAYRVAWDATEAGLAAARPGLRAEALFDVMDRVMRAHVHRVARTGARPSGGVGRSGHGLGIELTEPPSLMPGDDTELRAGMCLTLEPGFEFAPGRWMVHEENILITATGCELLSVRAPERLPRLDIG